MAFFRYPNQLSFFIATLFVVITPLAVSQSARAESYKLAEPADDGRARAVDVRVNIGGRVFTNSGPGKVTPHDLRATANYRFRTRRLSAAGRDAQSLREAREFEQAVVQTQIGDRTSVLQLKDELQLIVANGQRAGIDVYCPTQTMTRESMDLLALPGDPLAIIGMLPLKDVSVDETWSPDDWVMQMLCAAEAMLESKLECKLVSVTDGVARVEFTGDLAGARLGAQTKVDVSGHYLFNTKDKLVTHLEMEHSEKTSVGTIAPGSEVTVSVTFNRGITSKSGQLTNQLVESIPLEPSSESQRLRFDATPWGLRLEHGRDWHVFHANLENAPKVLILRLMDRGSLISQCNVSPVPSVKAGTATPIKDFEQDIITALGNRFTSIVAREQVPTNDGRRVVRITADGSYELSGEEGAKQVPIQWVYYLVTDPNGKQTSFVFAVEPELKEKLGEQDLEIVRSLQSSTVTR